MPVRVGPRCDLARRARLPRAKHGKTGSAVYDVRFAGGWTQTLQVDRWIAPGSGLRAGIAWGIVKMGVVRRNGEGIGAN